LSIKKIIDSSIKESTKNLKTKYFGSTLSGINNVSREEIEQANYSFLLSEVGVEKRHILEKEIREIRPIKERLVILEGLFRKGKRKLQKLKAKRLISRLIGRKRVSMTQEMNEIEQRLHRRESEIKRLRKQIADIKKKNNTKKQSFRDKAIKKSQNSVKPFLYKPTKKNLVVHSALILLPERNVVRI